jgi:1-acyl-sn-glycerol-3-phosphate acyltransferase
VTDSAPPDAHPDEESASSVDLAFLSQLGPPELRALLPGFLAGFIGDPDAAARNRARIAALVAAWTDDECRGLLAHLATLGTERHLYRASPVCRDLSREWTREVVLAPTVSGVEHLREAWNAGPTLVACNHTSYLDSNATDSALAWNGAEDLADRLVALAGPKVYADLFRRVAAGCINTLPVPQSTSFSHTEKLTPRELARRAHESLEAAVSALGEGYVLLLYPEGSRTRNGRLGPFLKGTHRYVSCVPEMRVVPAAIVGASGVMPVSDPKVRPGTVHVAFGPALRVGADGGAREVLEAAHAAVENLLPPEARPAPDAPRLA